MDVDDDSTPRNLTEFLPENVQPHWPSAAIDSTSKLRLLSRSPHPYHHNNADLLHAADHIASPSSTADLPLTSASNRPSSAKAFSTTPTLASDSGTEADDEHFLRGLPAPRPKPHKGLRGMNEVLSGTSTPLISPVYQRSDGSTSAGRTADGGGRRQRRQQADSGGDTDGGDSIAGSISLFEDDDRNPSKYGDPVGIARLGSSGSRRRQLKNGVPISPQKLSQKLRRDAALLDSRDKDRRQGKDIAERSRRRREIVRRSTEVLLLFSLATLLFSNPAVRPLLVHWRFELQAVTGIIAGLLTLYPIRLASWTIGERNQKQQQPQRPSNTADSSNDSQKRTVPLHQLMSVPASFDPAPLLYPLAIPILVSFLLATPTLPAAPLLNLILSICTLPKQLIPLSLSVQLYDPIQWTLSCVPMIIAETYPSTFKSQARSFLPTSSPFADLSPESATLLYPLHQTLCWLLYDLTTTSLLPAELQLMSVALVNLLVLAASPQAIILQVLLWGGSMSILIFGGKAVRWGIMLARIPRWRFRCEPDRTAAARAHWSPSAIVCRIWHEFKSLRRARLEMMYGPDGGGRYSDDDSGNDSRDRQEGIPRADIGAGGSQSDSETQLKRQRRVKRVSRPHVPQQYEAHVTLTRDDVDVPTSNATTTMGNTDGVQEFAPPPRFSTDATFAPLVPAELYLGTMTEELLAKMDSSGKKPVHQLVTTQTHRHKHTHSGRRKRAVSPTVRAFFALTYEQAVRRKWLYAGWLYACIALTILVGIRWYVGRFALMGHEPFGWALGYLFGDIGWFRLEAVKANLEHWVCLPPRAAGPSSLFFTSSSLSSDCFSCQVGWIEHVRQTWLGAATTRLLLFAYWALVIAFGLAVVFTLSPVYEVDTRRKVFHFMMVAMLLPATFIDPAYAALALALVLAVFLLLDLLRASQLPPLSRPIANFLTPYVDGRDLRGPVVISHIFLLIGCAIPLWLSMAAVPRTSIDDSTSCNAGWEVPTRDVSMVAGVICVGLGDAAASLIGRRWGRHKWLWGGGKSLEGSVAFATAVFAGLMAASLWLRVGGWPVTGEAPNAPLLGAGVGASFLHDLEASSASAPSPIAAAVVGSIDRVVAWVGGRATQSAAPRAAVCAAVASVTEAVLTGGNDNVVVPVILWTCVKSFGL